MSLIYRIINLLVQPFSLLMLLAALALANLWRHRRETRGRLLLPTLLFAALLTLCLPPVGYLAMYSLERRFPPLMSRPTNIDAIAILAGGAYYTDASHRRVELDSDTLHRCAEGAALFRQGKACPVIVSGGSLSYPQTPVVAHAMRDFLTNAGIDPANLIVEDRSRTSFESAVEVRKILADRHLHRVILVTEAIHMARSLRCYQKLGIDAVPAACHHRAGEFKPTLATFLPNPLAAQCCLLAFHEWLGMLWYRVHGRI